MGDIADWLTYRAMWDEPLADDDVPDPDDEDLERYEAWEGNDG